MQLLRNRTPEKFTGQFGSVWAGSRQARVVLVGLALTCAWTTARAVLPPPDGGYPNRNTAEGADALFSLTTGSSNTAVGQDALFFNTTGRNNTAIGCLALLGNTGDENTAIGNEALFINTTGHANTAIGHEALFFNSTGSNNTAVGFQALLDNTTGNRNTATGREALRTNSTGFLNTANGFQALFSNTTGSSNTADGFQALFNNTTGGNNTANGNRALYLNTTGGNNTANGWRALYMNTTASNNTAQGYLALNGNSTGPDNTALGYSALFNNTTGSNNIAIGSSAGINLTTGSDNIDIGALGVAAESNTIRIGEAGLQTNVYIAGISGATVPGGVTVRIDATGHLGTVASSARFKEAIHPMARDSEAILALRPVSFRYKKELDAQGIPQFGLIAEEVEKVNPDLVARDERGQALHRALRGGERDVAQRVPQGTSQRAAAGPQDREVGINDRTTAGGDRQADRQIR